MAEDLYEEGFGIEIRGSECDCNQQGTLSQ